MNQSQPDENSTLLELAELRRQNAKLKAIVEKMDSEQKKVVKELHRLSRAIEQSPVSVIITDIDGNIQYANPKALAITGYSKKDLIGENPRILNSGNKPKSEYKKMWETISSGKEWNGEFLNKKKNGELYWESASISPIFNEKQEIINYISVKEDITKQKKFTADLKLAKEKAEESEEKFKNLYESLSIAYLILKDGICIDCNKAALDIYGIESKKEIIGKSPTDFSPEFQPNNLSSYDEAIRQTEIAFDKGYHTFEWLGMRKNKELFYNEVSLKKFYYKNELYLQCLTTDITKRKKIENELIAAKEKAEESENALKHSHDLMKYIIEHNRSAIAVHDKDYRYIYVSQRYLQDYKVKEKDILGKHHYDVFPDLPQKWRDVHKKALLGEVSSAEDDPYYKDDGTVVWTRWECRPWYEKDNSIGGFIIYTEVITERKNLELNLKAAKEIAEESEKIFKATFYTSPDSVSISTLNGEYVEINEGFTRISGYTETEVLGKTASEINIWALPEDREKFIETLRKNDYIENFECLFRAKNGTIIPALVSSRIIMIKNEPFILSVTRDITERKKYETELIKAKEKAEESDRLKSAFLANMSHEIRTPMNGILGFSQLLKEPGLTGENQQRFIGLIEKSGARMLNTIQEIIDISKIESGQMKVNNIETNMNEKLGYVYNLLKLDAEQKAIQLSFKNSLPDSKAEINTDGEKLYGILINLVKNAIKYTNKGSIEFGYNLKGNFLEFYVKDTGIGIPKDRQKAIFERFIQADIADIEARQGAGLGLSITKAYVEMLGGKIWVVSETGIGTTFYFTLPYNAESEKKNELENIVPLEDEGSLNNPRGLKILIAEDDETSEILISTVVKEFSREVLKARTGNEAVEICRKNPDIDLILMDIQMPEMNGYNATKQIRQFNKDVLIIAQTAFGLSGDREKSIAAGCNDYISKPIKKGELVALIQKYSKK